MAKARAVDPVRLYEAMVYSAYMVEQFGDEYAWVLDRLESEWMAYLSREAPRMRARRILEAHTLDVISTIAEHPRNRINCNVLASDHLANVTQLVTLFVALPIASEGRTRYKLSR